MADSEAPIKPVTKCQSCGDLPPYIPPEGKIVKSLSVAQIGSHSPTGDPTKPTADGEATRDPNKVFCDFCLESNVAAVKTCLTCSVNYCESHLRPHLDNPKLHTHQLVHPMKELQTCSQHSKPLEWFCPVDLECLCEDCVGEQHRDHQPIPCIEARAQKEVEIRNIVMEYDLKRKTAENSIVKLEANTTSIENSVAEAKRAIDLQFVNLEDAVKKAHTKVLEFLEQRERAALNQSDGIKTYLEQKCEELKKRKIQAERIARHQNEANFLQEFCEFKKVTEDDTLPSVYIGLKDKLSGIRKVISESTESLIQMLQTSYSDRLQEFAKEEELGIKTMVSAIVPAKHRLSAPEPTTREDFLKYKSNVTLDPDTAHRFLRLQQDNRKVTNSAPWQHPYPDNPERFENFRQVLSSESFYMGRHYFEVEFKGEAIHVGVTYKYLDRKGSESNSNITGNDFSWTLKWNGKEFSVWHSEVETSLKTERFGRVGIYVNYPGGTVSFYGVSTAMTLLHKFECKFTEPIYAAFWLPKKENSVTILGPEDNSLPPLPTLSPLEMPKLLLDSSPRPSEDALVSSKNTEVVITTTIQTIKMEKSVPQETGSLSPPVGSANAVSNVIVQRTVISQCDETGDAKITTV
ncbi:tripartite motif-containing protein 16 [Discoglossus pictus]